MQSSWIITAPTSPPEVTKAMIPGGIVIALAAERADEAEIAKIRQCCNACADDIHNGSPHLQADIAFHSAIVEAAHNEVLVRITPMIHEGVGVFIDYQNHDQIGMTLQSHEAVCQAVKAKNPDAAEKAMRAHMLHNQELIRKFFAEKR